MQKENEYIGPYRLIRKLGEGGFGEVWLADNSNDLLFPQVAVKLPKAEAVALEEIRGEAMLWREVSGHRNVISFIEAKIYGDQVVIVSEFAEGGSLADWLKLHGGKSPNLAEAERLLHGILNGLEHLHAKNIIHRDIKPANILLKNNEICLADFGISRILKPEHSSSKGFSGTYSYSPPEAYRNKRSFQTDMWAVGVLFQKLLCGYLPFDSPDQVNLMYRILQEEPNRLPGDVPAHWSVFIKKCLQKDPQNRYRNIAEMRRALLGEIIDIIDDDDDEKTTHPEFVRRKKEKEQEIADLEVQRLAQAAELKRQQEEINRLEREKIQRENEAEKARRQFEEKQKADENREHQKSNSDTAENLKRAELSGALRRANEKAEKLGIAKLVESYWQNVPLADFEAQLNAFENRITEEEVTRRIKLEKAQNKERQRAELLKRLKMANERAATFGLYLLGESGLTEEKIQEFERQIAETEKYRKEESEIKQAELRQRIQNIAQKANYYRIELPPFDSVFSEYIVQNLEKKVAEAESNQTKHFVTPVPKPSQSNITTLLGIFGLIAIPIFCVFGVMLIPILFPKKPVNTNAMNINVNRTPTKAPGVIPTATNTPTPTPKPSPTSTPLSLSDIPEIGATVNDFKLFESGKGVPLVGNRKYETLFFASFTRYINWEIDLSYPITTQKTTFALKIVWYDSEGKIIHSQTDEDYTVQSGWTGSKHASGYGSEKSGSWKTGKYRIEVISKGKVIASKNFEVK